MNKGRLYLIPTILGENTGNLSLSNTALYHIKRINIFIVENIKTARKHIKLSCQKKDINNIIFYEYGKYNKLSLEKDFLPHILNKEDVGILSESGLPCIADPGNKIVEYAHNLNIKVVPISGPSSIFLSLMASGMNGQNFSFNGYLPIDKKERAARIRKLEYLAKKLDQTQVFIETPYRNNKLFETIVKTCNNKTKLCIASNITQENEYIKTMSIIEWKSKEIDLHKKLCVFLISLSRNN